jgi:hypothetical protein
MTEERPIGIKPINIWKAEVQLLRLKALSNTIFRYADKKIPIPLEWVVELNNLIEQL